MHVLIPTDFSLESELAIKIVKQLGEYISLKISILYVMPVNSVSLHGAEGAIMNTSAIQPSYLEELKEQGVRQIKKQAEAHDLQPLNREVIVDNISTGIIGYAEELDCDLIVMGTKQAKGLVAWLSGSDAQVVARLSKIPLLTVMKGAELKNINKILYLHNCKSHPLVAPHGIILKLQEVYNAELHLLYVDPHNEKEENIIEYAQDYIDTHKLGQVKIHVVHGDDVKKIVEQFQEEHFDLLCLGTHGRGQLSQLFKQSVAEYLIRHSSIPVLSYRM